MRKYIKFWVIGFVVITIIMDMVLFDYLSANCESIFLCNRSYRKYYPCTNDYVEVVIDDIINYTPSKPSTMTVTRDDEDREPTLVPAKKIGNDLTTTGEVIVKVDLVFAGFVVVLFFLASSMVDRKPMMSAVFSVAMVAFLFGSGAALKSMYNHLKEPGLIEEVHYNAPIIYLYDEQEREAAVKLDLNGKLTCTYPKYDENSGWIVKTSADGVLTDRAGRQYEYLYWEADMDMDPDFSKGFCVRGEDSADFLEKALAEMGLSDTEANTFIMYWLPQLEENPYNVIAFQTENYEMAAKLDVDPLPDTVVRVNMLFYGSDEYVEIEEQDLSEMNPSLQEREGLVLVEWGGGKLG